MLQLFLYPLPAWFLRPVPSSITLPCCKSCIDLCSLWLFIAIQFQLLQAKWELNMWVWTEACSFCQCQGVWENRSCCESRIMGANPFLSDCLMLTVQQTGSPAHSEMKVTFPIPFLFTLLPQEAGCSHGIIWWQGTWWGKIWTSYSFL